MTTRASSNAGLPIIEMIDDLEASMSHRGKAFKESRVSTKFQDNDKSIMGSQQDVSTSLYCKSSEGTKVQLDDFQLVSIIGKGNFGKVYLVYLPLNKQYYAMKSIRKDIVIDNDSIENVKLEKLVLMQVNHPFIVTM